MGLQEYHRKRDFKKTVEPKGKTGRQRSPGLRFVIQKHDASRLHYDLRLEMEGVLRSWAVPKGPTLRAEEKRLAVQVEDHPLDYGDFEGTIPKGQYGAGSVIVWDRGTYQADGDPVAAWKKGRLEFTLDGDKLKGRWMLIAMKGPRYKGNEWLFFKKRDEYSDDDGSDITEERPESVVSGKEIGEMGAEDSQWHTRIERALEDRGIKKQRRKPFPERIQPMLATLTEKAFDGDEWIFEIKYDGIRTLAYKNGPKVQLLSRNQNVITARYPELVAELAALPAEQAVLDGEICALDDAGVPRFQLLQPRMHVTNKKQIERLVEDVPVVYFVFDLLYCNGFDLMSLPLESRKKILEQVVESRGRLFFSEHLSGQGRFLDVCAARSLEGIVAKRAVSAYQQKRSRDWLKIKCIQQSSFVIGGWTPPAGGRKHLGALLLGQYDDGKLRYVGRVGTGFDAGRLTDLISRLKKLEQAKPPFDKPPAIKGAHWTRPELSCRVKFNEWTREGNLRAPVYLGLEEQQGSGVGGQGSGEKQGSGVRDQGSEPRPEGRGSHVVSRQLGGSKRQGSGDKKEKLKAERLAEIQTPRLVFTNLNKMYWPREKYSKGDLILYYDRIAEVLLPYLKDRPLTLKRHPNGIEGQHFYQKDAPDHTPEWIRTEKIASGGPRAKINYIICDDRETLLYLANLGCIEQHPWNSRCQSLDSPDWVLFDLDPEDVPFPGVQEVALALKEVLDAVKLTGYPKTSGATGIHVYVPVKTEFGYEEVKNFAGVLAEEVVRKLPKVATTERAMKNRHKKVYVDYLQNGKGKTIVAPYVLRPVSRAAVSTPLEWAELKRPLDAGDFNIETIFDRLEDRGDLFAPVLSGKQSLRKFISDE
ncbi:MAG: DNA ligase D [Acidobacteriota bacterium]